MLVARVVPVDEVGVPRPGLFDLYEELAGAQVVVSKPLAFMSALMGSKTSGLIVKSVAKGQLSRR